MNPSDAILEQLAANERPLEFARPPRTSLVRALLALLVAPVVFLIPVELVLALYGAAFTETGLMAREDLNMRTLVMSEGELYRPKPGEYPPEMHGGFRINSMGFRAAETGPKEPGTTRILALGDSTVFGLFLPEEQAWPSILERTLAEEGYDVEVVNMGRVATSSYGTRWDVEHYAGQLDPDVLIISVGWFNDFQIIHENPVYTEEEAAEAGIFRDDWEAANSPLQLSRLYRIYRTDYWRDTFARYETMTGKWVAEGLYKPEAADKPRRVPINQFREDLLAMCEWARERGLPIFFTTPAVRTAEEERYPIIRAYDDAIHHAAEECGATIIPTRQLLLELAREVDAPRDLWLDFVHLTPLGYRGIAELISQHLKHSGVLAADD